MTLKLVTRTLQGIIINDHVASPGKSKSARLETPHSKSGGSCSFVGRKKVRTAIAESYGHRTEKTIVVQFMM